MTRAGLKSVSDWYFEKNGERGGPVSTGELKAMLASGAVSLTSLVWTAAFGNEWKRLGDTELAPPRPVGPPPLPSREPAALPPRPAPPTAVADGFLDSELTKALIGGKPDHYLAKWRTLLAKAGGDLAKVVQTTSWNWPALFIPYGWLLFRKMYAGGGILLALQLVPVLLPDSVPSAVSRALSFATIGMGVVVAMYGNAWYFAAVRKRWDALRQEPDQAVALERAKRTGGVNWIAPIVAFALVIAAAAAPYLPSWNDPETLVRDGHMTGYASTTIGQAFTANFDDATWRSFQTDKGATIVEFSGKISAALHGNAVTRLANSVSAIRKAGSSKEEADLNEFNYQLNLFQPAHRYLDGKPLLQNLLTKWGCSGISRTNLAGGWVGMVPDCKEYILSFLNDAIGEWADEAHWATGTPVTVQWTLDVNGTDFNLTRLSSKAWEGLEQKHVLDILYQ